MIYRGFELIGIFGGFVARVGTVRRLYLNADMTLTPTFDSSGFGGRMRAFWKSESEAKAVVDNFHDHGPDRNIFTEEFLNQMHCSNTEQPCTSP